MEAFQYLTQSDDEVVRALWWRICAFGALEIDGPIWGGSVTALRVTKAHDRKGVILALLSNSFGLKVVYTAIDRTCKVQCIPIMIL